MLTFAVHFISFCVLKTLKFAVMFRLRLLNKMFFYIYIKKMIFQKKKKNEMYLLLYKYLFFSYF